MSVFKMSSLQTLVILTLCWNAAYGIHEFLSNARETKPSETIQPSIEPWEFIIPPNLAISGIYTPEDLDRRFHDDQIMFLTKQPLTTSFLDEEAQKEITETIQPNTKPTWKYTGPEFLGTSGADKQEDLNKLHDKIMFPIKQPVELNTFAHDMAGQPVNNQGSSISNLLDETAKKFTWAKIWDSIQTFGRACAAIIGFLFICRVIKFAGDIIVRGYTLHRVHGWSIHLLRAISDSRTNEFLALGKNKEETSKEETLEGILIANARKEVNGAHTELNSSALYSPLNIKESKKQTDGVRAL
ncbi:PREDICTED: uncharacterized protein LOC105456701 isoform X2 [Wasmannia auropunctata]|uniref:uncharacterized protein LOC105456701 isoform X2 n=1 Tax=Wasmannia auropunctata TaxID=64793 RepID=UPI0005EE6235|nr:PREDICTED: uncharacterized protein LOC105456701 isoform X2 [Wasmannia auropunctata]